jgi:hypothetical protein
MIRFLAFEKLGGFLSRSQALTHLAKHPEVATILGFPGGGIPTQATINAFEKRAPPLPWLMRVMVDPITDFFDERPDYDEDDPLSFFFWTLPAREAESRSRRPDRVLRG